MNTANEAHTDHFSARVNIDGADVHINTTKVDLLTRLIARLQGTAPATAVAADEKQEVASSNTGKPPIKSSAKTVETKASSESPQTAGEPASPAPSPAASPAPAAEEPAKGVSYDDVKAVINGLYAIDPKHAVALLAQFKVKKGPDLQPQQWPDVVAAGKKKLAELQGA